MSGVGERLDTFELTTFGSTVDHISCYTFAYRSFPGEFCLNRSGNLNFEIDGDAALRFRLSSCDY